MNKKRIISSILEIVIGIVLMVVALLGYLDEFWSGMGTALLLIGVLFLVKAIKYQTNQEYREKYDVEINDERNKYLSLKAWAWAGYLFVMVAVLGSIILKMFGKEELMMMASGSVCLIMIFYWMSYLILKKKY